WSLSLLVVAVAPRRATAQVGATTDIITGTVTGPDSQPLAGAVVQAISLETQISRQRTTDTRGRFTIVFPDGGGQYQLIARYIGMAPTRLSVARQADEDRLVAEIHMGLAAVPLEPVTVTARRTPREPERPTPGSTERDLSPQLLARLPIDASDLNLIATLAPGVVGIAGTDSTDAAFSVAGQRTTANDITLDGLSFGSGAVPQDAVRSTRVVTSTYDVARGQFSGGLVASTTRSGTNVPQGSYTYTLRDKDLAWGGPTSSPFGQGFTQNQLGGGMASLTSYFGGNFINEARGYVSRSQRDNIPYLTLPAGRVQVASAARDSGQSVTNLSFGGNTGFPQTSDNRALEITDEFSWLPGRTAHRIKFGLYVNATELQENQAVNQLGTFTFPSLAALAADSPATFTRTLSPLERRGTAWNAAAYLGDIWRAGGGLQLTYGARVETARFSGAPAHNPTVD